MPRVSVIISTYRRTEPLRYAICSVAEQTYKDIEIIVVDDNADAKWSSQVGAIVDDARREYPDTALKYIVNAENLGSAMTRNAGIDASTGEYITFLDDDDIYLPDKIQKQLGAMTETDSDYGLTDLMLYIKRNGKDSLAGKRIRSYIKGRSVNELVRYHLMYHMTGTDTLMFRKEYLDKIGRFDPIDIGDEFYLMHKAILGGGKLNYLPCCDVKAYIHTGEGGLSSGLNKIKGENAIYEFKKGYFDQLDKRSIRHIKMRHYAVLAYAELRMKHIFKCIGYGFKFLLAPFTKNG